MSSHQTEIPNDELRRAVRATEADHDTSMRSLPRLIDRLWTDRSVTDQERDDHLLGGMGRRGFLRMGGLTVMSAAVLAACGSDKNSASSSSSTTKAAGGSSSSSSADPTDVLILKTASSLEHLAISVYQKAIDNASMLGIGAGVASAATLFQAQHTDHANVFEKATTDAGATPFTKPNPAVLASIQPMIDALKTETDVVNLAYMLEVAAAETYQSTVGVFKDASYNSVAASVEGVEARHVAVLGHVLDPTFAKSFAGGITVGFQKTDQAVKAGTGIS